MTRNVLNTEFIKRRRVEVGLSNRAVASAIGVSCAGLGSFEQDANQGDVPLAVLCRLADSLGCHVTDLFQRQPPPDTGDADSCGVGGDAAIVGQVLHTHRTLIPISAVAEVTGWPHQRVTEALDTLRRRLPAVGMVLHRLGTQVTIRAAPDVDGDRVAAVVRGHINRDGLNITEIRLLRRILDGDFPKQPTNSEQVALGVLANARLIEADRGKWKPHPDVEFSMQP